MDVDRVGVNHSISARDCKSHSERHTCNIDSVTPGQVSNVLSQSDQRSSEYTVNIIKFYWFMLSKYHHRKIQKCQNHSA